MKHATIRYMYWADKVTNDIKKKLAQKINAGDELIVRDEKTASGRVHIGAMRGVAIHDEISKILQKENISARFLYEINDNDPMDGIPSYLDEAVYKQYLGMPLNKIPAPDGVSESFADQYAKDFKKAIKKGGFTPEYYLASDLYTSGRMNDVIQIAIERAADIRAIYKKISGSEKPEGWIPLAVQCKKCNKILTTRIVGWDGTEVQYECEEKEGVGGSVGCGHEGSRSPFDGAAKLPWKVEWPAKWKVVGVSIEGAGKDHSTRGGARDVANHISREIFDYIPPYDIPYEFFLIAGAKMSSSKGRGDSASVISGLLPTKIFRLLLLGVRPMRTLNFDAHGATIPTLYDRYDSIAEKYWNEIQDDDTRLFERLHEGEPPKKHFVMRFSLVAFIAQMPHMDVHTYAREEKGKDLISEETKELDERVAYALQWIKEYAPERYVFALQEGKVQFEFSDLQKEAFAKIVEYIMGHKELVGEDLHHFIHSLQKEGEITAKELFSGIYQLFLGRDSGPQVGWFLSVLPREYLLERLQGIHK